MITREEIKVYNRVKGKLETNDQSTQTTTPLRSSPIIIVTTNNMKKKFIDPDGDDDDDCDDCDEDADDFDDYEDYDEDEDEDGTGDGTSDGTGDGTGDGTSDGTGDGTGDGTSDGTSDGTGDGTSDGTSDGTGDGTGDGTSDGTSDDDINETKKRKRLYKKLKEKYAKYYNKDDLKYYKKLEAKRQKLIDETENAISKVNNTSIPLRFKILESDMDIKLKALAINKVDQLAMAGSSSENVKLFNYIDNLCKLPVGKYHNLPVSSSSSIDDISNFLDNAKTKLNEVVYGHNTAKDQIIRLLAKWISNPQSKGLVIGIEGVHGIGKTSLVKDGICQVLGLPFGFVTLGGISDGSYMVGHSYTYEGSRWGKIADILMNVKCMNPVLYFDELDKISTTTHGDEIANLLIHLTDSSQNDKFQDKYFAELDIDLSRCIIIFSYNNAELINPILRDRMVTIKANGYNTKDKVVIAKDYMLPKILKEFGFDDGHLVFEPSVFEYIIAQTEDEKGVRNLKRNLEEIASQLNLHRLLKKTIIKGDDYKVPLIISKNIVDKFVKPKVEENISLPMMYL
jgi:ATP-dependent Lon protease